MKIPGMLTSSKPSGNTYTTKIARVATEKKVVKAAPCRLHELPNELMSILREYIAEAASFLTELRRRRSTTGARTCTEK